jgi:hypothetical protein
MRPSVTGGYQLTTAARIAKERLGVEFLQSPMGGGWAKCVRHDQLIEIFSIDFIEKTLIEIANEALTRCPKCIEEIEAMMPPTRWPEGAEL